MPTRLPFAVFALLTVGCQPLGSDGAPAVSVTDSLGIAIVHNVDMGAESSTWTATPDLTIGGSGDPGSEFGYIADVAVDHRGRMYVLDQQGAELRIFTRDGAAVGNLGGLGEGPGEFSRFVTDVLVDANTLLVPDWGQNRVNVFGLDGQTLSARAIPGTGGARSWWQRGEGSQLWFRRLVRRVDDDGRWKGDDVLLRSGNDWTTPDTALVFRYAETDLGGPGNLQVPIVVNSPLWAVLGDGRVAWTTLDRSEIHVHGPGGERERIIRHDAWIRRAPSSAERAMFVEFLRDKLTMLGGDPDGVDQLPVIQPDLLPAITALHAGADGRIWVQRMGAAADVHPMALNTPDPPAWWAGRTWDVIEGDGHHVATVELPPRFRMTRVVGDYLYGVVRDELDVEMVVRLQVRKP